MPRNTDNEAGHDDAATPPRKFRVTRAEAEPPSGSRKFRVTRAEPGPPRPRRVQIDVTRIELPPLLLQAHARRISRREADALLRREPRPGLDPKQLRADG